MWRGLLFAVAAALAACHAAACPPAGVTVAVWRLTPAELASNLTELPRRPPDDQARAPRAALGPPPPLDTATTTEGTALQSTPWPGASGGAPFVARVRGSVALRWPAHYNFSVAAPPGANTSFTIDGAATDSADVDSPRVAALEAVLWWPVAGAPPPFFALLWQVTGRGPSARGRRVPRGAVWDDAWVAPGCSEI